MKIEKHPFKTLDWKSVPKEIHKGISGIATWQTIMMGDIRVRLVEYSKGYVADHWCNKGHVIHCLKGRMMTGLYDGKKMKLKKGMSYIVGDDSDPHRSSTKKGCKLFIVD
jgi:hypothetical protein